MLSVSSIFLIDKPSYAQYCCIGEQKYMYQKMLKS